jgi:hypothetical protein
MSAPGFLEGVGVALVACVLGGLVYSVMILILPTAYVLRYLIAGLGLAYIVYLLSRTQQRTGRLTTLVAWLAIMMTLWLVSPSLFPIIFINLTLIWLVRSWYFHTSLPALLADLALNGFALLAGIWAVTQSGSLLLGLWCFFLVQALFVAIPAGVRNSRQTLSANTAAMDQFQRAQRTAETALQRLSSHS